MTKEVSELREEAGPQSPTNQSSRAPCVLRFNSAPTLPGREGEPRRPPPGREEPGRAGRRRDGYPGAAAALRPPALLGQDCWFT